MNLELIGIAHTPFKDRFGIPRQGGMLPEVCGEIIIHDKFSNPDYWQGLNEFSHLWIIFNFNGNKKEEGQSALVRVPRLKGQKMGVFATRSPYRPNGLGLSVVELDQIEFGQKTIIKIKNHDLLDGTEIIDIKPYIPEWDKLEQANNGWLQSNKELSLTVITNHHDYDFLSENIWRTIVKMIELDPRPSQKKNKPGVDDKLYSIRFDDYDFHWQFINLNEIVITGVDKIEN